MRYSADRFQGSLSDLLYAVVLAILSVAPLEATAQEHVLQVPAKELPLPTTVSLELQDAIANAEAYTGPTPSTDSEWREAQVAFNADFEKLVAKQCETLKVTFEASVVGGVKCYLFQPAAIAEENRNRLLLHVHGGAYVFGAGLGGQLEAVLVTSQAKCKTLAIDYRMPPDHPFPAAIDDVVAVWKELLVDFDPQRVGLYGSSTGGGLTLATILKLKALSLPLPGALFAGTPWTDLTKTGDSYFTNAEVDSILLRYEGLLEEAAKLYANGEDLTHELISPIYGDFSGFPPTVLISGTRDLFLSNTVRAHRKLRAEHVLADLHVYEGQSHAHYMLATSTTESHDAMREVAEFFGKHLKE